MSQHFTPDQKLMALSWKQPFASLMLHGKTETRTWNTNYRGWVLICASKQPYRPETIHEISGSDQHTRIVNTLLTGWGFGFDDLVKSKAIAVGKLIDCRPMIEADEDRCFVKYWPALYCHIYEQVKAIEWFDWKGTQGWKEVSKEVKDKIKFIDKHAFYGSCLHALQGPDSIK